VGDAEALLGCNEMVVVVQSGVELDPPDLGIEGAVPAV
jgi:hypothetical protein